MAKGSFVYWLIVAESQDAARAGLRYYWDAEVQELVLERAGATRFLFRDAGKSYLKESSEMAASGELAHLDLKVKLVRVRATWGSK